VVADVPTPPGITRMVYTARFTGKTEGVVLVAFPADHGGKGNVAPVALDQDLRSVQGYVPGIYSVTSEVAAQRIGNESRQAVTALLAEKGHVCVKKIPRVFNVPTTDQITSIADVFQVSATTEARKTTFVKTQRARTARARPTRPARGCRPRPLARPTCLPWATWASCPRPPRPRSPRPRDHRLRPRRPRAWGSALSPLAARQPQHPTRLHGFPW
jgi:hypothetical protein